MQRVSEDVIKNTTKIDDIESCIENANSLINFNVLKRNLLLKEGITAFQHQLKKYRKILLEILMCPKEVKWEC